MRSVFHNKYLKGLVLAAGLGTACASVPAFALDAPFEFDTGRWMSSKTYEDNIKRHGFEQKEEPAAEPEKKAETAAALSPVAALPKINSAVAALSPPAMPGLNKGFNLQVSSSEDEDEKKIHLSPSLTPGDVRLPEKKWLTPSARDIFSKLDDDDQATSPLKVRMTFLPAQNLALPPSSDHESIVKKGHDLLRKMTEGNKPPEKTPEEIAACAALDAYKKQQLDAIQSDRQTLNALQNAIKSLGFSKQLDFITKKDSALNTSSNETPVTASVPAETSVR